MLFFYKGGDSKIEHYEVSKIIKLYIQQTIMFDLYLITVK